MLQLLEYHTCQYSSICGLPDLADHGAVGSFGRISVRISSSYSTTIHLMTQTGESQSINNLPVEYIWSQLWLMGMTLFGGPPCIASRPLSIMLFESCQDLCVCEERVLEILII